MKIFIPPGSGEQLHVLPGRRRHDHSGPDPQPHHAQTQQAHAAGKQILKPFDITHILHPLPDPGVRLDGHQLHLLLHLHEDEAAGLHAELGAVATDTRSQD